MILGILILPGFPSAETFLEKQKQYPRVRQALKHVASTNDSLLKNAGINTQDYHIFIQAFKHEQILELWASNCDTCQFKLIKSYPFTAFSGILGPKRARGDYQIPEGLYFIDRFNAWSKFHLSLGLNYPNKSDRIRTNAENPGGDIFIHGNRVTIGCIPLGDDAIEELYIFAIKARSSGQKKIRVYIFPFRFDGGNTDKLKKMFANRPNNPQKLWAELGPFYFKFKQSHIPPRFIINTRGEYHLAGPDIPSGQN